jgi:hypothetical protein
MSRDEINNEQIRAAQAGDADAMWAIVEGLDAMLRGIVRSVAPNAARRTRRTTSRRRAWCSSSTSATTSRRRTVRSS